MLQVYKRMFQGMFIANAFNEGAASWEMLSNPNSDIEGILSDFDKNGDRLIKINELTGIKHEDLTFLMDDLGFTSARLREGVQLGEIANKIRESRGQATQAIKSTSKVERAKPEVRWANPEYARTSDFVMEASTGDIDTGETKRENEHRVLWVKVGSTEVNLENANKEVRLSSLNQVLSQHDAATILAEINANKKWDNFTNYLFVNDGDIKAVSKAVKSRGYNDRGLFKDKEAGMIYSLLSGVVESQAEVSSLTGMEKINRLLDVNQDGKLNAFTNAKYGEAQAASILDWMTEVQRTVSTEAQFNKLLRAININPVSFNQNLDTNFFLTRQNFAEALKANSAMVSSLSSLVGGKTAEFTMAQIEVQENNLAQVENLLLANQSVKDVMDALDPSMRQVELTRMAKDVVDDLVEFEGGWMLFTPHGIATAASATIANDYHASIGKIEWGRVAVTLERKVFGDKKTNVNVGVGTDFKKICIYVSGSRVLREGFNEDTVKNWTSEELYRGNGTISAHAVASLSGVSAGLNFDKSKSAAIENQVATIKAELTKVGNALIADSNTTFDSLGLEGEASDIQKNREVFDMIRNRFVQDTRNLNLTWDQKKLYMDSIVAGYAQYIENNLYFGNEGLSLSGGGIGILAGHPVAFASFEDINAKWNYNDVNNSATAATYEATRERGFTEIEIGAEKSNIGRFDTLLFRGMDPRNISAAPGTGVEIQHTAEGVHIAWNVTSIDLVRYVSPTNEKADILVINGWNVNGTEMVPGGYATDVASSIPQNGTEVIKTGEQIKVDSGRRTEVITGTLSPIELEATMPYISENVRRLRTTIDSRMDFEDIKADNTQVTPLKAFQDKSVDYALSGRDIDTNELAELWKELTTYPLKNLMTQLIGVDGVEALMSVQSDDEKLFIIDSITMAQRNDRSVEWVGYHDSVSEIKDKQGNSITLREYYEKNTTMKRRMVENLAKTSMVSEATIELKYQELMNTMVWDQATQTEKRLWDMSVFNTEMRDGNIFGLSSASQSLTDNGKKKSEWGEYIWIRDTSIAFYNGVNETIVFDVKDEFNRIEQTNGIPVDISNEPKREKIIRNLPLRMLQREVDAVNQATWGKLDGTQFDTKDLEDAMLYNTALEGRLTTVTAAYDAMLTFTGNCMNLELDGEVRLTKMVAWPSTWGDIIYDYIDETTTRTVSNIQYGKASMDGYQTAEFDVNRYVLWVVVETNNNEDGLGTQGRDGDGLATQGRGQDWVGQGWNINRGWALPGSTPIVTEGGQLPQSTAVKTHNLSSKQTTTYISRNIDDNKQD